MPSVHLASEHDIEKLIPAYRELRPHRTEQDIRAMLPHLFNENFSIIYLGNDQIAWALLGFRIFNCLWSGKTLYIDDLVTLSSHTHKGYAAKLFDWIKNYAKEHQCDHLALNSGFQRREAYRFYLNQGLFVESMHFGRKVAEL